MQADHPTLKGAARVVLEGRRATKTSAPPAKSPTATAKRKRKRELEKQGRKAARR